MLRNLAFQFSPIIEQTNETTVVFSIDPLRHLIGSPHQIASEICRAGDELKLQANLAIASNPDSAILLACYFQGVTLVTPGEERAKLGCIPLSALFLQLSQIDQAILEVLLRWGVKTLEDLAALPEVGLTERLGAMGSFLHRLACGSIDRPLHVSSLSEQFETQVDLEHRLELLEPLLFLLGRTLNELCAKLRSQAQAARVLAISLKLEDQEPYRCELEFPVPLTDSRTMLKLLQLHLEHHSPPAPVLAFTLKIEPAKPRRIQGGIFLPPMPPPDKLQLTLARIAGMVGRENVGTPALLQTHRPDAFQMLPLPATAMQDTQKSERTNAPQTLTLVMRLFRPALPARVRLVKNTPRNVAARAVKGDVLRSAGPWKTSGEWWTSTIWSREEWDVALDDGALYRIYQDSQSGSWYVNGMYD
ncbi:MAG: hypothetical protein M3Y72_05885 [Acidobacteriota bacterium]|nr:hypothetical protein [Acidobacteriota bacterium]